MSDETEVLQMPSPIPRTVDVPVPIMARSTIDNEVQIELERMLQAGAFENEQQIMRFLEDHKVDLEAQPTDLLLELAERLKGRRGERFPETEPGSRLDQEVM